MLWTLAVLAVVVVVVNLAVVRLPAMPPPDGKFISLRGKEIHYTEQVGTGTPVVLLHGLPGTHRDFDPVLAELSGMRVFALDRPGFGWSDGGWLPYQNQIDVVHDFLASLDIAPALVVGYSFGGTLALGLARRYPRDVAGLVLIAPAAGGMRSFTRDTLQARYLRFSQLPVVKSVIKYTYGDIALWLSAHFGARGAFAPDPVDPTFESRLLAVTLSPGNVNAFARDQLEYDDTMRWVDDNVAAIRVPAVEIAAAGDQLVPYEHARRLAATLPGTRLVTVDGNHMIPYRHPGVVAAQIRQAVSVAP